MVSKNNKSDDSFRNKKRKCDYYDRGYCKYGDKCDNEHPDKICLNPNCFDEKCPSRHPNPCKYGPRCHYNRKNSCFYSHITIVNPDNNKETFKKMENMIEEMSKKMKHLENKVNKTSPEKSELAKQVETKIDLFESQLKQLRLAIEDIDESILDLKKKVKNLENKCKDEEFKELVKRNQELEKNVGMNKKKIDVLKDKLEIVRKPEDNKFACNLCDFKANSKQGLKTHETRKHTKVTQENFPKQCNLCAKTFKTKDEMDKHVITHSYKSIENLQFKCEECDFWCPNSVSIESHIKKHHSENITCGICEYEAKTIDELEGHIETCQTYKGCCNNIYKTIPDLKIHINEVHKGGRWCIRHTCIDPNNQQYLIEETDYSDLIFRRK